MSISTHRHSSSATMLRHMKRAIVEAQQALERKDTTMPWFWCYWHLAGAWPYAPNKYRARLAQLMNTYWRLAVKHEGLTLSIINAERTGLL